MRFLNIPFPSPDFPPRVSSLTFKLALNDNKHRVSVFLHPSKYKRFLTPEDNFLSGEHEIKGVYYVFYRTETVTIYEVQSADYSCILSALDLYKRQ